MIKRTSFVILILVILSSSIACQDTESGAQLQDGDIIFQVFPSSQSRAIQIATDSRYSHVGIVYINEGEPFVFEAIQPVGFAPLEDWIARDEDGHYVLKRLKNAAEILTPSTLAEMKKIGEEMAGKDYDVYFEWSDDRLYCSELVWKIYQRATGLEIGELKRLGDFNLSHPIVAAAVEERYGDDVPLDEPVISPEAMFQSELLRTVIER